MITLGREFISPNEAFPCADDLLAEGANHSAQVDHFHYGIVYGVPRLTNNEMAQHRWLSEQWASVLGLSTIPPPEPVRLVQIRARQKAANPVDENQLARQISEQVKTAIVDLQRVANPVDEDRLVRRVSDQVKVTMMDILVQLGLVSNSSGNQTMPIQASSPEQKPSFLSQREASVSSSLPPAWTPSDGSTNPPEVSEHSKGELLGNIFPLEQEREYEPIARTSNQAEVIDLSSEPMENPFPPAQDPMFRNSALEGTSGVVGKRCWPVIDLTEDEVESTPSPKRLKYSSPSPFTRLPFTSDDDGYRATPHSSSPIQLAFPSQSQSDWRTQDAEAVRAAIRKLVGSPTAREKSAAQLKGILHVLHRLGDAIITLRTGGGKSMMWLIPALLSDQKFLVVCPFAILLDEQCTRAQNAGIKAINYSSFRTVPSDVQILFVQVEHIHGEAFKK